jgi:hypothetical protein
MAPTRESPEVVRVAHERSERLLNDLLLCQQRIRRAKNYNTRSAAIEAGLVVALRWMRSFEPATYQRILDTVEKAAVN